MNIDIFVAHFSELEDPRQAAKVVYPLFDVVFSGHAPRGYVPSGAVQ